MQQCPTGSPHAPALLHQIRTPFGADRSAANGTLSAIAADTLIEIRPLVGSDGRVNNPYSPHCCVLRRSLWSCREHHRFGMTARRNWGRTEIRIGQPAQRNVVVWTALIEMHGACPRILSRQSASAKRRASRTAGSPGDSRFVPTTMSPIAGPGCQVDQDQGHAATDDL